MGIFTKDLNDRLWFRIFLRIVSIGLMGTGLMIFISLRAAPAGGMGEAFLTACVFVIGSFIFAGGLIIIAYPAISKWVGGAINGLVFSSAALDEPALMLSPVKGKITAGRFEEALRELSALSARYPDNASICLVHADLHEFHLNDPQAAFAVVRNYLSGSARGPVEDCVQLVLRYTDSCMRGNLLREAVECVEKELRRSCYTGQDRLSLRKRLNLLRKKMNNHE